MNSIFVAFFDTAESAAMRSRYAHWMRFMSIQHQHSEKNVNAMDVRWTRCVPDTGGTTIDSYLNSFSLHLLVNRSTFINWSVLSLTLSLSFSSSCCPVRIGSDRALKNQ